MQSPSAGATTICSTSAHFLQLFHASTHRSLKEKKCQVCMFLAYCKLLKKVVPRPPQGQLHESRLIYHEKKCSFKILRPSSSIFGINYINYIHFLIHCLQAQTIYHLPASGFGPKLPGIFKNGMVHHLYRNPLFGLIENS